MRDCIDKFHADGRDPATWPSLSRRTTCRDPGRPGHDSATSWLPVLVDGAMHDVHSGAPANAQDGRPMRAVAAARAASPIGLLAASPCSASRWAVGPLWAQQRSASASRADRVALPRQAIEHFRALTPPARPPRRAHVAELLLDPRFTTPVRHLRAAYTIDGAGPAMQPISTRRRLVACTAAHARAAAPRRVDDGRIPSSPHPLPGLQFIARTSP